MWSLEVWVFLRGVSRDFLVRDDFADQDAAEMEARALFQEVRAKGFLSGTAKNGDVFFVPMFDHLRAFPTAA